MKRLATTLFALLVLAAPAWAQTVKEIKAVSAEIEAQLAAKGADLTEQEFIDLTESAFEGQEVTFTAVVLSDPFNSGNASTASRIHVFVRDTTAVHDPDGMLGYGIQFVDGSYRDNGWLNIAPGYVVKVTSTVTYFNEGLQLTPSSVEVLATDYSQLGLPDSIMDPVVVEIADVNQPVPYTDPDSNIENQVTINFENYDLMNEDFIRIEGASVLARAQAPTGRPNWVITNSDKTAHLQIYDISLRYRNDRAGNTNYTDAGFNVRDTEFIPPPVGATVNLQGFAYANFFDAYGTATPDDIHLTIVPFEDSDLEVTEAPPSITEVVRAEGLVTGSADVTISANVKADDARTITSVMLNYGVAGGATTSVAMVAGDANGDGSVTYTGAIPAAALEDGNLIEYFVTATDNLGGVSDSATESFLVLSQITSIAQIQTTTDGGAGDSPLAGTTVADGSGQMDITAVVMSDPGTSGYIIVQDDASLAPWTGIYLESTSELLTSLETGDVVNITGGTITEDFGGRSSDRVTGIRDVVLTETGTSDPYAYKVLTTNVMIDNDVAEAYEGMMVRFENVKITEADAGFGEWKFSSDGSTDTDVRADDGSEAISSDFNVTTFAEGDDVTYIQGIWGYTFGSYKLFPEDAGDVGEVTLIDADALPDGFSLSQSAPNPATGVTTIRFAVDTPMAVTLAVYDMMGRRVATLAQGVQPASEQTVSFDTEGLASGVYVYRLHAGDVVTQRKLVVVK